MTAAGGLALNGAVLLLLAIIWGLAATEGNWRKAEARARVATVLCVLGTLCLISAPWMEVVR